MAVVRSRHLKRCRAASRRSPLLCVPSVLRYGHDDVCCGQHVRGRVPVASDLNDRQTQVQLKANPVTQALCKSRNTIAEIGGERHAERSAKRIWLHDRWLDQTVAQSPKAESTAAHSNGTQREHHINQRNEGRQAARQRGCFRLADLSGAM